MLSIVIIGTGNLAEHLLDAFLPKEALKVVQVVGRSQVSLAPFKRKVPTTTDFLNIADADLYLLAVSDDAIRDVSERLSHKDGLATHISGSVPLQEIQHKRRGVFYPVQSFTKGKPIDFKEVPICLEAESKTDLELLRLLAGSVSETIHEMHSEQRQYLHLAAVFANNFTNHLYHLAREICDGRNIPFDVLRPLIGETARKIQSMSPYDAQTGPARRQDRGTLEKHGSLLEEQNHKTMYKRLSESIQKTYAKEL
ncbi:MAG: DUF2520 domain-containing protein [Bacteroidota bacterium]